MRLALASVIAPLTVLLPLTLRSAPPLLMPVPFSVKASASVMPPDNSSAAPASTVVPPADVPKDPLFVARSAPALIVVAPV